MLIVLAQKVEDQRVSTYLMMEKPPPYSQEFHHTTNRGTKSTSIGCDEQPLVLDCNIAPTTLSDACDVADLSGVQPTHRKDIVTIQSIHRRDIVNVESTNRKNIVDVESTHQTDFGSFLSMHRKDIVNAQCETNFSCTCKDIIGENQFNRLHNFDCSSISCDISNKCVCYSYCHEEITDGGDTDKERIIANDDSDNDNIETKACDSDRHLLLS